MILLKNATRVKLSALNKAAKEFTTMVRLLSIDGGVKNKQQDLFDYVYTIESFVRDKTKYSF